MCDFCRSVLSVCTDKRLIGGGASVHEHCTSSLMGALTEVSSYAHAIGHQDDDQRAQERSEPFRDMQFKFIDKRFVSFR